MKTRNESTPSDTTNRPAKLSLRKEQLRILGVQTGLKAGGIRGAGGLCPSCDNDSKEPTATSRWRSSSPSSPLRHFFPNTPFSMAILPPPRIDLLDLCASLCGQLDLHRPARARSSSTT